MRTIKNNRSYVLVGGAAMVVVIVGLFFQQAIIKQLDQWSLLPRSQAVTELYFTQPKLLPLVYTPNQPMKLDFTVKNNSEHTVTYTYAITQNQEGGEPVELQKTTITLGENSAKQVAATIKPLDTGDRSRLAVQLEGRTERINIWVTKAKK